MSVCMMVIKSLAHSLAKAAAAEQRRDYTHS
nr:MAG TPA: hypothetical protein [Caudoviricetes sp.]